MKKILIKICTFAFLLSPTLVLAATAINPGLGTGSYLPTLVGQVSSLLGLVVKLLIALAVVWFIWNVIRYAMSSEEDGKEKAKQQMIHGIIAIAVTVSIWGIVAILRGAFGVDDSNSGIPSTINTMIPNIP